MKVAHAGPMVAPMASIWWIGLAVPAVMAFAALVWVSRTADQVRRGSMVIGAAAAVGAWAAAWLIIRVALGPTPPALEAAFLQLAAMPLAVFFGAVVGMVAHWRRTR